MNLLFDIILGLTILTTAWGVFSSRDLFRAVVMFIAFGLLLALVWVRLDAPDLALAEAAIGAGLTGVLLIDAVGHLQKRTDANRLNHPALPVLICSTLTVLLILSLLYRPDAAVSLPDEVTTALPDAGVDHPVTAVLLNFRSYDTLLEIAVLLVAVVVAMSLAAAHRQTGGRTGPVAGNRDPVLSGLGARLVPAMLITAGYILWAGSYMPGGAFQSGAVLAAALVFLKLADYHVERYAEALLRLGLTLGFVVFLTVATSVMIGGRPFLTYPDSLAGQLIFLIEAVLSLSIGLILFSLFTQNPAQEVVDDDL